MILAKRLGIEPKDCLVFEDSLLGVQAAVSAGMPVIACPDSRLDIAEFLALTPFILQDSSLENFGWSSWEFETNPII